MSLDTVWPFVLEFVLELTNERSCNEKQATRPSLDTPTVAQSQCLIRIFPPRPIIALSLSPRVILAIAESPASMFAAVAITRSFGSILETARKHRGVFRYVMAAINRRAPSQLRERRSRSNGMSAAKISFRQLAISRSLQTIA